VQLLLFWFVTTIALAKVIRMNGLGIKNTTRVGVVTSLMTYSNAFIVKMAVFVASAINTGSDFLKDDVTFEVLVTLITNCAAVLVTPKMVVSRTILIVAEIIVK